MAENSWKLESTGGYGRTLAAQLRGRALELEEAILDRLIALGEGVAWPKADGTNRLSRSVLRSALEYGFISTEHEDKATPPLPPALLAHARAAASKAVPLQAVVNQYLAGYSLFKDFMFEEQELGDFPLVATARRVFRSNDIAFERLVHAAAEEHEKELRLRTRSRDARQLNRVEDLLSGRLLDIPGLSYNFDGIHIGLVGTGKGAAAAIRSLADALGLQRMMVHPSPETVWAWVGARTGLDVKALLNYLPPSLPSEARLAVGEPAPQLVGWRRSHRQAKAALAIGAQGKAPVVHYAEVPLVASAVTDDLLQASLREMYLVPLATGRDGGCALRETLRAYFAAGRNGNSAAFALGFSRQTVAHRLQKVEERLGQPLENCADALHMALQLEELGLISA